MKVLIVNLLLALPALALAQEITCEYTKETTTAITFSPNTPKEIPSLPYHIICTHQNHILINTSSIRLGKRTALYLSAEDVPFHLSYTHQSPQTFMISRPDFVPRPRIEAVQVKQEALDQSFLGKYWMYIVPFVLVLLFSGGGEDEPAAASAPVVRK